MPIDNPPHDRRHPVVMGMAERCVEASGVCARLWIAREIERMRSEIAWLGKLKAELWQTR